MPNKEYLEQRMEKLLESSKNPFKSERFSKHIFPRSKEVAEEPVKPEISQEELEKELKRISGRQEQETDYEQSSIPQTDTRDETVLGYMKEEINQEVSDFCDECDEYIGYCKGYMTVYKRKYRYGSLPSEIVTKAKNFYNRVNKFKDSFVSSKNALVNLRENAYQETNSETLQDLRNNLDHQSDRFNSLKSDFENLRQEIKSWGEEAQYSERGRQNQQKKKSEFWGSLLKPVKDTWLGGMFK